MKRSRARGASARSGVESDLFEQALLIGEQGVEQRPDAVDRKTLQLCRQVERALSMAFAGECDDDVLRELAIVAVEPMGSASQMLVHVSVPVSIGRSAADVLAVLEPHAARLRHLIARAICRKRTPTLHFVLVPADQPRSEGGAHFG